jgi:hypothetical protein
MAWAALRKSRESGNVSFDPPVPWASLLLQGNADGQTGSSLHGRLASQPTQNASKPLLTLICSPAQHQDAKDLKGASVP